MTARQVVMVTRRFWPARDGAALALERLAAGLFERGIGVTVLTALWLPDGPRTFVQRGVQVVHLGQAPVGWLDTLSYGRCLAQWLTNRDHHYDAVIVSGLGADAYAVLGTVRRRETPVILRVERSGLAGDCHRQLTMPCGVRVKRRCLTASALVAASPLAQRELVAAGYPRPRIHELAPGVPLPSLVDPRQRHELRYALGQVDPALAVDPQTFVVLMPLAAGDQLDITALFAAWRSWVIEAPQTQLWLWVDASWRVVCREELVKAGLQGRVVIVEDFEDPSDLFVTADVLVQPVADDEPRWELLEALAHGLPTIVAVKPKHDPPLVAEQEGLVVAPGDMQGLMAALRRIKSEPGFSTRLRDAGRATIASRYDLDQAISGWQALLSRVLQPGVNA